MNDLRQKLCTLQEIVEYLQLSRDKVLELIQKDNLPAQKIGKQWRFYIQEVDEWVKAHRTNQDE